MKQKYNPRRMHPRNTLHGNVRKIVLIFWCLFLEHLSGISYTRLLGPATSVNQRFKFSGATTPIFNLSTLQLLRGHPKLQFLMPISQSCGEDQNMRLVSSLIHGMRLCMDIWATSLQSRPVVLGLYSSLEGTRRGFVSRITSAATPGFVGFTTKPTKISSPGVRIVNYALFKSTGNVMFVMHCLCTLFVKEGVVSYAYSSITDLS